MTAADLPADRLTEIQQRLDADAWLVVVEAPAADTDYNPEQLWDAVVGACESLPFAALLDITGTPLRDYLDVPWLLSECRRLRDENQQLRGAAEAVWPQFASHAEFTYDAACRDCRSVQALRAALTADPGGPGIPKDPTTERK